MKHRRAIPLVFALALVGAACTPGGAATTPPGSPAGSAPIAGSPDASAPVGSPDAPSPSAGMGGEMPDELVIGFVPSREADALVETIQPVADYLSEQLGIPVEGVVTTDYTGLVTAMESDQAHIGAFGPFSLLQARDRAQAEIILQSERFGSATYHTQFMTNNPDAYCDDEPVEIEAEIDDVPVTFLNCNGTADASEGPVAEEKIASIPEGTTFSFVEQASASGYIFPATVLINNGIDHETGITPLFAGSHDASVIAVCNGDAEVGAAFDDARTAAETECDVSSEVVVFAYGPEIPNDGWAVAGDLPQELKDQIKQALLDYSASEDGAQVLNDIYEIDALVEADLDAFTIVEQAAAELGITGDD
ncbi:MAG: phosphate/phosphite/phosphonate ABC transporter substrate-binding protein [Chloroflexota bacterium]|nr:phosphate/phosphite/phosphonate ABC transporter substrate-binding protein [Chloroflexota bacterium]